MKSQSALILPGQSGHLNRIVAAILEDITPEAVLRNSFFINEIPGTIVLSANESALSEMLRNLLNTVVTNTENSCIRVTAGAYGGIAFLTIKDSGNFNNYNVNCQLKELQPLARKIGGCISFVRQRVIAPSIAFSFPNNSKAA
jgi:hypothetical protein